MKYIVSVHGSEFTIDQKERDGLYKAINAGHEFFKLNDGSLISTKIGYCREVENRILSDKMYIRYREIENRTEDCDIREKMRLEAGLNAKYPYNQYAREWDEAKASPVICEELARRTP